LKPEKDKVRFWDFGEYQALCMQNGKRRHVSAKKLFMIEQKELRIWFGQEHEEYRKKHHF